MKRYNMADSYPPSGSTAIALGFPNPLSTKTACFEPSNSATSIDSYSVRRMTQFNNWVQTSFTIGVGLVDLFLSETKQIDLLPIYVKIESNHIDEMVIYDSVIGAVSFHML